MHYKSIFWCYVLPDSGPFQPKHVVNKFLMYV